MTDTSKNLDGVQRAIVEGLSVSAPASDPKTDKPPPPRRPSRKSRRERRALWRGVRGAMTKAATRLERTRMWRDIWGAVATTPETGDVVSRYYKRALRWRPGMLGKEVCEALKKSLAPVEGTMLAKTRRGFKIVPDPKFKKEN